MNLQKQNAMATIAALSQQNQLGLNLAGMQGLPNIGEETLH